MIYVAQACQRNASLKKKAEEIGRLQAASEQLPISSSMANTHSQAAHQTVSFLFCK